MRITPLSELQVRVAALQKQLAANDIDLALLVQNADLFYFTGSIQQGVLLVPAVGEPLYLVRKDYGRARMESGLRQVVPFRSPKDIPGLLQDHGLSQPARLGLELDVLPVNLFQRFSRLFGAADPVDVSPAIRTVRAVKSEYEIAIMKDAAIQADRVFQRAKEVIRVGMTDLELAAELELVARREGHQGITRMRAFNAELFYGHVFSGPDGAVPAGLDAPLGGLGLNPSVGQGVSYKTIAAEEPIIVDFVTAFDGYLVDQTRTFCIGGLPEELVKAHDAMLQVQNHLKQIAKPGVTWGGIYDECLKLACDLGYRENFMGASGAQVSFIGHGIGIEVDEYPFIARGFNEQKLEKNMTFAFEPKAVFPGLGAVGIENTYWVAEKQLGHLTYSDQELVVL
ncbi:MAG: aminopeptidase P family protein [Desulfuromonas sp.]|nr:MAG: aminopeptidase P family protein [Desulfuromonas sp.]